VRRGRGGGGEGEGGDILINVTTNDCQWIDDNNELMLGE
jgi:hypothetical protein